MAVWYMYKQLGLFAWKILISAKICETACAGIKGHTVNALLSAQDCDVAAAQQHGSGCRVAAEPEVQFLRPDPQADQLPVERPSTVGWLQMLKPALN